MTTNAGDRARLTAASIAATQVISGLHRNTATMVFAPYVTGRVEAELRQLGESSDRGILQLVTDAIQLAEILEVGHLASRCQFIVAGGGSQYRIEPSADVMTALESFSGSVADLVIEGQSTIDRPQLLKMIQQFGFEVYESYPDLVVVPSLVKCGSSSLSFPEYLPGLLQVRAEEDLGLAPAVAMLVAMAGVQRFAIDSLCGDRNAPGFPVEYVLTSAAAIDLGSAARQSDYSFEAPGVIRVRHRGLPMALVEVFGRSEMDLLRGAEGVIEGFRAGGGSGITGAQLLGLRAWQE